MSKEDFIRADDAEARWPELFNGKSLPEFRDPDGNVWVRQTIPHTDPRSNGAVVYGYRRKAP